MNRLQLVAALSAIAFCVSPAIAGPLAIDTNTYGGIWHGSTQLQAFFDYPRNAEPSSLRGHVDWAVYAPGQFPSGFTGYAPAATEFVYAYQLNIDGNAAELFRFFEVTLEAVAHNVGTFIGDGGFGEVDGANPTSNLLFGLPFSAVAWDFEEPITAGLSKGLVFTAPARPKLLSGTFITVIENFEGALGDIIPVPTPEPPLPEPSSLILGLFAVAGLAAVAMRKRRARRLSP